MRELTYSLTEIREVITNLPEQFDHDPAVVTVTQDGKPVMTILPTSIYKELFETVESLLETLEVIQDEELMVALHQGMKELEEGKGEPWEDVLKELAWE